MRHKIFFRGLLLSLMIMLSANASADEFEVDGFCYSVDEPASSITARVISYNAESSGDIVIPASVTYNGKTYSVTDIGFRAFSDCSALTSIKIPNSVTYIEFDAFSGCSGLTSIEIPNSVTHIGLRAFQGCIRLTSMEVESGNAVYDSRNGCNALIETATNTLIAGCKNTIIPNSVTTIGYDAFSGCSALTSIDIPNSVTSIETWAFANCSALISIDIPNSVTYIGDNAFFFCSGLTSVEIPNSVRYIGDGAFSYCSSLTSIDIPNSVTYIGEGAFFYCSAFTSIEVESGNAVYDSREGCNALIETATNTLITGCKNTIIPNSVTAIGNNAFDSSGLTSIKIPNSVTSIGEGAFHACEGLTSIEIPNSVTTIEYGVFFRCYNLTSIELPSALTSIGQYAFRNCSSLTSIELPNSVTSIGDGAFALCFSLTSIELPNSVTYIGEEAFYLCRGLTSIDIPNSVTYIGDRAFHSAHYTLTDVYCQNPVPCTLGIDVFEYYLSQILHVPTGAKAAYQAAEGWKNFTNIVEMRAPKYEVRWMIDNEIIQTDSVEVGKSIEYNGEPPTKEGYIFSGWSEIPETMPAEDVTITGTFVFDYNTDAYKRLNSQIAELQSCLDAAKETINTECADVAEQFAEQTTGIQNSIDALTADVKAKYDAGELTADSQIETTGIVAAIEKLLADVKTAQQAYEVEQEKIAANEAAYTILMQKVAELQSSLDAVKQTINTECKDIVAQFTEQIASIQNNIDALTADVKIKYDSVQLTGDSEIDTASVIAAIEKLLADAKATQQAKIAANEAAYTKLMQEIAELQASLDDVMEFINTECEDVAAQFAEQIASIQNAIDALLNDINAQYANCALTVESTIYVADIVDAIETTMETATEEQKKHEETVGIYGINVNGAKVKAIYNLNGERVSTTKPNQMYIIEYSDGRKVKAIVKK